MWTFTWSKPLNYYEEAPWWQQEFPVSEPVLGSCIALADLLPHALTQPPHLLQHSAQRQLPPGWHSPPGAGTVTVQHAQAPPPKAGALKRGGVNKPEFGSLWLILLTVSRTHVPDWLWGKKITDQLTQFVWNYCLNHCDIFYSKINRIWPRAAQKIQSTFKSKNIGTKLLQHIPRNVISTTQHELILYHFWMYQQKFCACMQASKTEI